MSSHRGHVMTLANSIIGVGILAMPFCFAKCGIILSILLLIISNAVTRLSCHYLLKSSLLSRRRNFEFLGIYGGIFILISNINPLLLLAFHAFGSSGKFMVEFCIIGYLMGTCIAYYVVVGDLGPQIIAKIFNINESNTLRTLVMILLTVFCVIPLGLLKNVDSLAAVCTASIGFYFCMVVKIIAESKTNIASSELLENIAYWRPDGVLQCLPIFSMALSCQMQMFEVYETMYNASIEKMNNAIKSATTMCTFVYILVGFFGYVAYCTQPFSGNILLNFSQSLTSDIIKIGFVISVAFSFPLVIFPCRASLYSLLYRRGYIDGANYIPEFRFKVITVTIVICALTIGILIPSIELVIGLVGSTIGVAICIMFPASCYIKVNKKDSNGKLLAQIILTFGFVIMILGTYANLNAIDEKTSGNRLNNEHYVDSGLSDVKLDNIFHDENREQIKINDKLLIKVDSENAEKLIENNKESILDKAPQLIKEIPKIIVKDNKIRNEVFIEKLQSNEIDNKNNEKEKYKIITTTETKEINKDAIKKEEQEIEAQEKAKNEIDKKEIKETKELLEQQVSEIKDVLAKQNQETQKLVLQKIEEFAEKVEKFEKQIQEVHTDTKANEEKPVITNDNDRQVKLMNHKIQENNEIADKADNQNINNLKSDKNEINNHNNQEKDKNLIQINDLLKKIDNQQQNHHANNDNNNNNNSVNENYEPMSYKLGELINANAHDTDNKLPLPIPLIMSNASKQVGLLNTIIKSDSNKEEIPAKDKDFNENDNNIARDAIRRDLLEVNTNDNINKEAISNMERNKRDVENEQNCKKIENKINTRKSLDDEELLLNNEFINTKIKEIHNNMNVLPELIVKSRNLKESNDDLV